MSNLHRKSRSIPAREARRRKERNRCSKIGVGITLLRRALRAVSIRRSLYRLDMNNPPTAVGGIPDFCAKPRRIERFVALLIIQSPSIENLLDIFFNPFPASFGLFGLRKIKKICSLPPRRQGLKSSFQGRELI